MLQRSQFNEFDIVEGLNGQKIGDLSPNMLSLLQALFGVVSRSETIYASKVDDYIKPDVLIKYKDRPAYVSIKSGEATIVHQGRLSNIVKFFRDNDISEETIEVFLLYHYGDGTLDGSGKKRLDNIETNKWLSEKIAMANIELNQSRDFIKRFAEYVMFKGVADTNIPADAVYHGNFEKGICIIKDQFMRYFDKDDFTWINNLHIGPFLMRPHARYANTEIRKPIYRELVDVYWNNLNKSMLYINRHFPSFNYHMKNGIYK